MVPDSFNGEQISTAFASGQEFCEHAFSSIFNHSTADKGQLCFDPTLRGTREREKEREGERK